MLNVFYIAFDLSMSSECMLYCLICIGLYTIAFYTISTFMPEINVIRIVPYNNMSFELFVFLFIGYIKIRCTKYAIKFSHILPSS